MALRQRLIQSQSQLQTQVEIDPHDYYWMNLGCSSNGVSNDEGYSKEYLKLGFDISEMASFSSGAWDGYGYHPSIKCIELTEKFYYTNSHIPHHRDKTYYQWDKDIIRYIDKKLKSKYS